MKKRLSGKVIIITGAESGIGKSIALRCVEDGASVVAAGLDGSGLQITCRECIALSGEEYVTFRLTDVRDPDAIEDLVNHTISKFGHIDAAVANAGVVLGQQPLTEITLEDWNT
ncbi:MAG: Glucose 1-dehydrogenase, partial [Alphaproteobacteria bacterium MarineAlpha3_Bin7]